MILEFRRPASGQMMLALEFYAIVFVPLLACSGPFISHDWLDSDFLFALQWIPVALLRALLLHIHCCCNISVRFPT